MLDLFQIVSLKNNNNHKLTLFLYFLWKWPDPTNEFLCLVIKHPFPACSYSFIQNKAPQEELAIQCRHVPVTFLPCQHLLCTGLDWSFYSTKERKAGPNFFVPSPFFWEFCSQKPPSQLIKRGGESLWWKNSRLASNNSSIETELLNVSVVRLGKYFWWENILLNNINSNILTNLFPQFNDISVRTKEGGFI